MGLIEQLKDEYLIQCANYCNHGGYTFLSINKDKLRQDLISKYCINGNKEQILDKIKICEETVFSFLEELSRKKFRHYMWITIFMRKN